MARAETDIAQRLVEAKLQRRNDTYVEALPTEDCDYIIIQSLLRLKRRFKAT